jgi:hypothetical protein
VWGSQDFVAVATYSKAGFVTSENRPGESTGTRQRPGCRAVKQCRSVILKVKYLSRNKTVKLENRQSGFRRKVLDKVEGTLIDANDR